MIVWATQSIRNQEKEESEKEVKGPAGTHRRVGIIRSLGSIHQQNVADRDAHSMGQLFQSTTQLLVLGGYKLIEKGSNEAGIGIG